MLRIALPSILRSNAAGQNAGGGEGLSGAVTSKVAENLPFAGCSCFLQALKLRIMLRMKNTFFMRYYR